MKADRLRFDTEFNVFEDIVGTIKVATFPRLTPTSKFVAVNYYWFIQHVDSSDIDTKMVDLSRPER